MNEKTTQRMVGWLFHFIEGHISEILKTLVRSRESQTPFDLKLPWIWYALYGVAFGLVWAFWPEGKAMPNELWIGVLSFEGLLAGLLAAVGPATISQGVLPFAIRFWSGFDPGMREQLLIEAQQLRDDPTQSPSASPFQNAFLVGMYSLFLLPLPLILNTRWTASLLVASLFWTTRRILPAGVFFLTDYAPVLPTAYWVARSWHEELSYCPECQGVPKSPTWPPPRPRPQGAPLQQSCCENGSAD